MSNVILDRQDIQLALCDLRTMLQNLTPYVQRVSLFGSTVSTPVEEAKDIDFFIAYMGTDVDDMRRRLLSTAVARNVVVESVEAQYSNHPEWPKEDPLRMHIILYRDGVSELSEKLRRTMVHSINVTDDVLRTA